MVSEGLRISCPQTPFFWMCDDNLAAFMRIQRDGGGKASRHCEGALFREAFMHVQRHERISTIALAGFLRADGTEVAKTYTQVYNNFKLYKVYLLNSLRCEGVNYMPALANFEDVAFNRSLILAGRQTLKFQNYAYHVIMTKHGGCAAQRGADADKPLVHHSCRIADMSAADCKTIAELQAWVRRDMHKPMPKRLEQQLKRQGQSREAGNSRARRASGSEPVLRMKQKTAVAKRRKIRRVNMSSDSSSDDGSEQGEVVDEESDDEESDDEDASDDERAGSEPANGWSEEEEMDDSEENSEESSEEIEARENEARETGVDRSADRCEGAGATSDEHMACESHEQERACVNAFDGLMLHLSAFNATGYKGVFRQAQADRKKCYRVYRRGKFLGYFMTALEGAIAYARCKMAETEASAAAEGAADNDERVEAELEEVVEEAMGIRLHLSARSSTGYLGVSRLQRNRKRPFSARLTRGGDTIWLGHFATACEAAVAYAQHAGGAHGDSVAGSDSLPAESSTRPADVANAPVPAVAAIMSGTSASTHSEVFAGEAGQTTEEPDDAPCLVCGKTCDPAHTLLCDGIGCGRAYHLYCLQPPLTAVPQGKWLCPLCIESWNASDAGSHHLARTIYEQEMRVVRNLRRQPTACPS